MYYAHLDKQLVHEGQQVKKGDVVGLVGNTGNARFTPSHLHFGVYTVKGPIDPLPFVNPSVRTAPSLAEKIFVNRFRLTKAQRTADGNPVKAATPLVPLAADAKGFLAETPDGRWLQVPFDAVQTTKDPVRRLDGVAVNQAENARKS